MYLCSFMIKGKVPCSVTLCLAIQMLVELGLINVARDAIDKEEWNSRIHARAHFVRHQ